MSGGKGYVMTASDDPCGPYVPGALHIETAGWLYEDDRSAARAARRDGVRLIFGIPYIEDDVYVNTAENRALLKARGERLEEAMRRRKQARE